LPPTVDDEGEAAEQALSHDQAEISDDAPAGEHSQGAGEGTMTDHAHTDASLSLPGTVDDEGEAADQAMSHDASDQADADEHRTPPDHSGQGAT
jgi:hypothetical protein